MASFVKFQDFVEQLGKAKHDLSGTNYLFIYLTNATPSTSAHAIKGDLAGITEQFGCAAASIVNVYAETGGIGKLTGTDKVWTAAGGSFGPFRYVVLYNENQTSPVDPLIGYWDYGSSITVNNGETFTVDFDAANGILTIE